MTLWQNWSGSVTSRPTAIRTPSTLDEIVAIVNECRAANRTLRVVGAGHSFTPLVATEAVLVSLDDYTGLESVDQAAQTVTVKAGTRIKALGEMLFQRGFAQENLGDIDVQTIAGAISTGTHGTGIAFGSLSTQVCALTLVTGDGQVVECSETNNRELFKAAQVSMGALGIIVSVTLRVLPAYKLRIDIRKKSLSDCLTNLDTYKRDNRHFEFHWIPYTDTVQAKFANVTDEKASAKGLWSTFNEYAIENAALWLFSAFNRQFPANSERVCRLMANFISDATNVDEAHRVFASVRLVKFQEMEYNLPAEHFAEAIHEIDATIRRERFQVHFPIECRFVRQDDITLSPASERESCYIAVHMFKGMPYRPYFDAMEAIFKKYNGRPHWGKMHTRTAADLRGLYPHWDDFQQARQTCDPQRVFTSPYVKTILGNSVSPQE
jgi:FAD-linked oxidoreductase